MATFFGEVVFSASRAIDDDDDEDSFANENSEVITLDLSPAFSKTTKDVGKATDQLVVTLGPAANVFADCYILHQEKETVGTMNKRLDRDGQPIEGAILSRLREHTDVLLCKCVKDIEQHLQFSFVEQLFSFLGNSNTSVTILSSCSGSDYQTHRQDVSFPIFRCLKTSSFTGEVAAPHLEPPNTISGLASSALSYCQIHGIPAVMYVIYTDSIFMDSGAITAFNPLLKLQPFRKVAKKTNNFQGIIKAAVDRPSNLDSLYT
ncbi:hypothetical protein BSL78_12280 [Apostichopus japonicus]|uniref:Proteasome assembly chaperone 1 n=1 Tax=Stichopus japonicus TaxID=307972 RepID=A0A2G8KSB9_STIJA|nr:hypothetical protein BSL78_12280 [Apostichopus japonicus]